MSSGPSSPLHLRAAESDEHLDGEDARLLLKVVANNATLNRVGSLIASELDLNRLLQAVTDAGVELSGAAFGAFFYNAISQDGETYNLYTLSGAPREAFSKYPMPRNTAVFGPTFRGEATVRSEDITKDPRYGRNPPYRGMPEGHLPVRSYLAVPVVSRAGETLGGLFFGHPEAGRFGAESEELLKGLAAQAAVAIDNARLYEAAQYEIRARKAAEQELRYSNERLRLALAAAAASEWIWESATDALTLSPELSRQLGLAAEEPLTSNSFRERFIHPDDRAAAREAWRLALRGGADFKSEYRLLFADGSIRWFIARGGAVQGESPRMTGVLLDITDRRTAEQELRARSAQLETIMQTVPALLWIAHDPEAKRITGSQYAARKLQLPPEANQSRTADPDERPRHFEVLRDGVLLADSELPVQRAARGEEVRREELQIRFEDGSSYWELVSASPVRAPSGEVIGAIGAAVDLSDRKAAEERQNLLLAELDHRVKNMLALVQALAQQTLRNDREGVAAFTGRLAALARTHALLAGSGWAGAKLNAIVAAAVSGYDGPEAARVSAQGPDMRLAPSAAQSLGLALHEMATNAAKYGALSVPEGRVEIRWERDGSADRRVVLEWRERGGPTVRASGRRGFGTRLIEHTMTHELNGRALFEYAPEGVRTRLEFAAPAMDAANPPDPGQFEPRPAGRSAEQESDRTALAGRRILLVEDSTLIAMQLAECLSRAGAEVVGPVARLAQAMPLAEREALDFAVLDVNLGGEMIWPAAEILRRRNVPLLLLTGYDAAILPKEWRNAARLSKPVDEAQLLAAIARGSR